MWITQVAVTLIVICLINYYYKQSLGHYALRNNLISVCKILIKKCILNDKSCSERKRCRHWETKAYQNLQFRNCNNISTVSTNTAEREIQIYVTPQ